RYDIPRCANMLSQHSLLEITLTCQSSLSYNILLLLSIGPTEGLVQSSRHSNGDQRVPLSSLLSFLSSRWGFYEPWRHSRTSGAAINPQVKDLENFWNNLQKQRL
ncbi:hypothetical protein GBF38_022632, partial [Nibea albiflora]